MSPNCSSSRTRERSMPARSHSVVDVERRLLVVAEGGRRALTPCLRRAGRELLADDAQRQELVALQAQNRPQPLEVLVAEEPVAALGPLRREQALVLEVADLRDRHVGELGLQRLAHGADRQPLPARRHDHQRARNVSRYLPICSSSPSDSSDDSTRRRFTNVPFRLPWSSTNQCPSRSTSTAWRRETVTSSRKTGQSGERPMIVRSPCGVNVSPARPPPERTTRAGPSTPRSSSSSRSLDALVGAERLRLLRRLGRVQQRPALGAVVRGLRVLEAALGAVDVGPLYLGPAGRPSRRGSPSEARRRPG